MSLNNNSPAVYDPRKALLDELHDVDVNCSNKSGGMNDKYL